MHDISFMIPDTSAPNRCVVRIEDKSLFCFRWMKTSGQQCIIPHFLKKISNQTFLLFFTQNINLFFLCFFFEITVNSIKNFIEIYLKFTQIHIKFSPKFS